jgi:hypothetical protein
VADLLPLVAPAVLPLLFDVRRVRLWPSQEIVRPTSDQQRFSCEYIDDKELPSTLQFKVWLSEYPPCWR